MPKQVLQALEISGNFSDKTSADIGVDGEKLGPNFGIERRISEIETFPITIALFLRGTLRPAVAS